MNPVEFEGQTNILGKPEGMSDDQCGNLPVKAFVNDDKMPCVESVWELTEAEMLDIIATRRIRVGVIGNGVPPFYIEVEKTVLPKPAKVQEKGAEDEKK